ncbi:MAG TPA: acyl carrier protein [Bryobacteraceae bacterium]|jgi:acyl carrier protein
MDNVAARLTKVFQTVFPDLPADQVPSASQRSVGAWDSVAAITLMNLIEEEFEMTVDFDQVAELSSFSEILEYLRGAVPHTSA